MKKYLEGDNDLQVRVDRDLDVGSEDEDIDGDAEHVIEMDLGPPSPEVKPLMKAVEALEDVSRFLESRGGVQAHSMLGSEINVVGGLKATTSQRTTIINFPKTD